MRFIARYVNDSGSTIGIIFDLDSYIRRSFLLLFYLVLRRLLHFLAWSSYHGHALVLLVCIQHELLVPCSHLHSSHVIFFLLGFGQHSQRRIAYQYIHLSRHEQDVAESHIFYYLGSCLGIRIRKLTSWLQDHINFFIEAVVFELKHDVTDMRELALLSIQERLGDLYSVFAMKVAEFFAWHLEIPIPLSYNLACVFDLDENIVLASWALLSISRACPRLQDSVRYCCFR